MFLDSPPCVFELIGSDNRSGSRRTATAARRQLVGGLLRPQGTTGYAAALNSTGCGSVDNALRAPRRSRPFVHKLRNLRSRIKSLTQQDTREPQASEARLRRSARTQG